MEDQKAEKYIRSDRSKEYLAFIRASVVKKAKLFISRCPPQAGPS